MFSDGKIIDEVLKQRLESQVYSWFREINALVSLKPDVILDKDPTASPAKCKIIIFYITYGFINV